MTDTYEKIDESTLKITTTCEIPKQQLLEEKAMWEHDIASLQKRIADIDAKLGILTKVVSKQETEMTQEECTQLKCELADLVIEQAKLQAVFNANSKRSNEIATMLEAENTNARELPDPI